MLDPALAALSATRPPEVRSGGGAPGRRWPGARAPRRPRRGHRRGPVDRWRRRAGRSRRARGPRRPPPDGHAEAAQKARRPIGGRRHDPRPLGHVVDGHRLTVEVRRPDDRVGRCRTGRPSVMTPTSPAASARPVRFGVRPRPGRRSSDQPGRVDHGPDTPAGLPGDQMGSGGGKDVTTVEGAGPAHWPALPPPADHHDRIEVPGLATPPSRPATGRRSPLSGPTSHSGPPASGDEADDDPAPLGSDPRVDHGQHHARSQEGAQRTSRSAPGSHVEDGNSMGEVDDRAPPARAGGARRGPRRRTRRPCRSRRGR